MRKNIPTLILSIALLCPVLSVYAWGMTRTPEDRGPSSNVSYTDAFSQFRGRACRETPGGEHSRGEAGIGLFASDKGLFGACAGDEGTLPVVPVVVNDSVESFLKYFQTTGRKHFERWLARAEGYDALVKSILRQEGLPEDLFYIAFIESGLNPKYTFDTFVIGSSNRFAHAAALAVAEAPARAYNPLFIYGGVGLGKTHLLQAVATYVAQHSPRLSARYVACETLTNDFINSIREKRVEAFKHRYRHYDVLLVDDVQFLENKERIQEEFFHTFNTLYEAGHQIILSSDRPPRDIATLEERLRSRFEWGLIVDVQPPDLETREAILRKKVMSDRIAVPDSHILTFIASRISTNIRELEGALTRVIAFSSLTGRTMSVELAQEVLKDVFPQGELPAITIERIQEVVSERFGISHQELIGQRRSRSIVYPRHVAMYLCRELTDSSLPKIGTHFGGRDHTTVINATSNITRLIRENRGVYNLVQELTARIKHAR